MKSVANYTVDSHTADSHGNVRPSAILRYMQETANLQHHKFGPTMWEMRERGVAFILSSASVKIYVPLHEFEKIEVSSWLYAYKGFSTLRFANIMRGDELAAELHSVWALVDIREKKLIRPETFPLGFGSDGDTIEYRAPLHVKIPRTVEPVLLGERTVRNSDIDLNRHMNNTNYPDALSDFIPGIEDRRICEFGISYLCEAPLGCTFKVFGIPGESNANEYFIKTVLPDGRTGAEARFVFADDEK